MSFDPCAHISTHSFTMDCMQCSINETPGLFDVHTDFLHMNLEKLTRSHMDGQLTHSLVW